MTRSVDWFERLTVASIYAWFVYQRRDMLFDPDVRVWFVLYLVSEGLAVLFLLLRRHTDDVTLRPQDWLLTVVATSMPMAAMGGGDPFVPVLLCALLVVIGLVVQLSAKLALARSFGLVAANRGVKVNGPYQFVRHPMYAGYLISHVGLLLASPLLFNVLVYAAALGLQIIRMGVEERVLREDATYRAYAQRVRYRLIPGAY